MSNSNEVNDSPEDDGTTERKTLHQQLKENRERKHKEYRQQMESQNSSYKLDDESKRFYESLREKELQQERDHKSEEAKELEKFRRIRQQKQGIQQSVDTPSTKTVTNRIVKPAIKVQAKKLTNKQTDVIKLTPSAEVTPIVCGYSSSEDDTP